MRIRDLFQASTVITEAPKPVEQYSETKYGTWNIKFRNKPTASGDYEAIGLHPRNPNTPKQSGKSQEQAIDAVKKLIDKHKEHDELALKYSKVTVDYNVEFTRDVLSETGITGVRLVRSGGNVVLIVAGVEYLEAFGKEIYGTGPDNFTKIHVRKAASGESENSANLYCSSLTINQMKALGLKPNARYALDYSHKDMDYGHQIYNLIFDSDVLDKGDKSRLHAPGVTIAVY